MHRSISREGKTHFAMKFMKVLLKVLWNCCCDRSPAVASRPLNLDAASERGLEAQRFVQMDHAAGRFAGSRVVDATGIWGPMGTHGDMDLENGYSSPGLWFLNGQYMSNHDG